MAPPLRVDLVDISHWQEGGIDWAAARAAGVRGVIIKATEGGTVVDDAFDKRSAQARAAGWRVGAYAFAHPEPGDAAVEAQWFLRHAKPKPGDLRPWLDLEVNSAGMSMAELGTWARRWLGVVEDAIGVRPLVYTPFDLGDLGTLLVRPRYNNDNRRPALPWDIHQFSDGVLGTPRRVAGFPFPTDLNNMRPGLRLRHLLIPAPDEPPRAATGRHRFVSAAMRKGMTREQWREQARDVAHEAGVIGWTETYEESDQAALKALGDGWAHHFPPKGGTPISWRPDRWKRVSADAIPLHPATPGVCRERMVTYVVLEHRVTGARVMVSDAHYVPIRAHKLRLRLKMWREGNEAHKALVASFVAKGMPAIILGDFNRKRRAKLVMGRDIAGQPVTDHVPDDSLDHIITVNGKDGQWTWEPAAADTLPKGHSDHHPQRLKARLVDDA